MKTPGLSRLVLPLLLLAAGLALRLSGIGWGLPDRDRLWSYHPDESQVVVAARGLNVFGLQLDSGFYNYGQGYLLAAGTLIHLGEAAGLVPPSPENIPSAGALLAARLLTALLGALTCLLVADTGRRLYGDRTGVAAGLLAAVAPLAVQHGHFATVDVPATFCVALALSAAARYVGAPRRRWLLACAVAAGFAAATKYNAGLSLLSGAAAWWVSGPRRPRDLALLPVGAAVAFLLGCPGAAINFSQFRTDLLFEAAHMGSGSENLFVRTPPGWIYHLGVNLPWALGPALTLTALAGVAVALRRRAPGDAVLAAFALPYFLLIGAAQVKFARYGLPLFPALLLWSGALCEGSGRGRRLATVVVVASGTMALLIALGFNAAMAGPDPRDQAARHLRDQGVHRVGFARRPWFWSPPLAPGLAHFSPLAAYRSAIAWPGPPTLAAPDLDHEWDVSFLAESAPDAVALSELEYADVLRLGDPKAKDYLAALAKEYPRRTLFFRPVALPLLPFTRLDESRGLPMQRLPHDMTYPNPTVVVFER